MSILIKGMEMPKSCNACMFDVYGLCLINKNIEGKDELTHSCPLVPVPPHGRLIDADALYTRMEKAHTDWREHPERYNDVIPVNADEIFVLTEAVVIPADKEDNNG